MSYVEHLEKRTVLASVLAGFGETVFASGIQSPTAMDFAPDGRLYVCEQGGAVRVIENGQLLPQPFVTLDVDSTGERGLLGIAFDPAFASNPFVYVYSPRRPSPTYTARRATAASPSWAARFTTPPVPPAPPRSPTRSRAPTSSRIWAVDGSTTIDHRRRVGLRHRVHL